MTDAYGETFYYYGLYGQAQELRCSIASLAPEVIADQDVRSLADLRYLINNQVREQAEKALRKY